MGKIEVTKRFGSSVRVWRGRLGISQEELAGRAGLHRTYVCDIERGARNVSLKSIEKIAEALGVSMSTLFASDEAILLREAPAMKVLSGSESGRLTV